MRYESCRCTDELSSNNVDRSESQIDPARAGKCNSLGCEEKGKNGEGEEEEEEEEEEGRHQRAMCQLQTGKMPASGGDAAPNHP